MVSSTSIMECLSLMWMELAMAALAAITYVMLLRRNTVPKQPPEAGFKSFTNYIPKQGCDQEQSLSQLVSKALRQGKMKEAVALAIKVAGNQGNRLPANMAFRFLSAAANAAKFEDVMLELAVFKGKIASGPLEAATADAWKNGSPATCCRLHQLSNVLMIPKSQQTFQTLASAYSLDGRAMRKLVQEAEKPLPIQFAKTVLNACAVMKDSSLAAEVLEKVASADAAMLRKGASALADLQAKHNTLAGASATTSAGSSEKTNSNCSSPRTSSLDEIGADTDTMETNPSLPRDVVMRANDVRSCGRNGDLQGALKVYERLDGKTADSALVMNSIVDACVACKSLDKAVEYFNIANKRELADTVTYNTLIKGYLADGQEDAAKRLLDELLQKGLVATRPSYHGLLNARISLGDYHGAWRLVGHMQLSGISPNAVTCSILLKGKPQSFAETSRVLTLVESMDEPMDEVLFLSVVEACIRIKRLDMLTREVDKFLRQGESAALTAPTYGSTIKAFGRAHMIKQVWSLWHHMIGHSVQPTSVTLGCMVEALVANGCATDAWQLTRKMWNDGSTRPFVNTVIYSSILKGFASAKETEKVLALYQEMRAQQIRPNTITYNTIINAFAQTGQMHRVPSLLEDMKTARPAVEPDIVTYSTIVKGFCNSGNLDWALGVLKDMKANGKCTPDEVMYNCLLGGCFKEFRPDDALQLLSDMKATGIAPSNYTLSMLVKLMGRCKRINQAFNLLEDISQEYCLKINIQVYTCLIQGCFNNGQPNKAVAVHDKIIKEGLLPDAMTYTVLVKGCLQAGNVDKAIDLARCAYGCGQSPSCSREAAPGLKAGCLDEVIAASGGASCEQARALMAELEYPQAAQPHRGF